MLLFFRYNLMILNLCTLNLRLILSLINSHLFAENSMDQDVYGAYSKQRIESLTTDGEGEF